MGFCCVSRLKTPLMSLYWQQGKKLRETLIDTILKHILYKKWVQEFVITTYHLAFLEIIKQCIKNRLKSAFSQFSLYRTYNHLKY